MATDFPTKGDDKKISLRNSQYPQFDYDFASQIKKDHSDIWKTGGNIRGNEAYEFWTKARDGQETEGVLDWIKEREAWAARHFRDGQKFKDGKEQPNLSNVAGVVAQMKWGVIGNLGEQGMKDVILELVKKLEGKKERAYKDLSGKVQKALDKKVEDHNEKYGDNPKKRATKRMLAAVFERGVGAYNTNPGSVRPGVTGADQWAYARVNSFLFALRNGRFQGGKHDTDLFPEGHPLSSKERAEQDIDFSAFLDDNVGNPNTEDKTMTEQIIERHIQKVEETDDAYVITFGKSMPEVEERPYHDEDEEKEMERFDRTQMSKRSTFINEDDRFIDEDTRMVRIGVSSEEPVDRSFGREVIDHSRDNMNLEFLNSGRAPLLLDHKMDQQIGRVMSVELDEDDRRLRAVVQFGKGALASEVFDDVRDGIRANISVGYRIDGRIERESDPEDYVRIKTTPLEVSVVAVPADMSSQVGVGRSASETLSETTSDLEIRMTDEVKNEGVDIAVREAEVEKATRKAASDILTLAAKHNKRDLGDDAIRNGVSYEDFRGQLLEALAEKPLDIAPAAIDAPVKEQREYSLGRMIQAQVSQDWRKAGFEREIHDEISRRVGREADGVYVPDFAWGQRGPLATAATGGSGSEVVFDDFVPTEHRGDMFIEALRARQVLGTLGTTYLSGLTNRIKMPKLATGANAAFVEELADVGDGAGTDGGVTLQPRTMGAFVEMSRQLIMESVPSIEQIIRNDLLASAADRTEFYAINGSGSGGQPTGILNTSGINNLDISSGTDVDSLTWADIIALVKLVEEDNGIVNSTAAGFLSHPAVKAKLASTAKVSSTDSVQILDAPWTELYGQPIEFTSNVPTTLDPGDGGNDASALIYGDFSQLMIAQFGAPSILIDPYSNSKSGTIRMVLHAELDVGVRNAVSFAKTDEVSIA